MRPLRDYSLRLQMPRCSPFSETASATAALRDDLTEVLPYLNAELKDARYEPNAPALTLDRDGHHISVWPRRILVSHCAGEEEAREVVDWVCEVINGVWERRDGIEPDHRGFEEMTALEALRLLPGGDCRECGEAACLPFAMKLVGRQAHIQACRPLFSGEHEEKRRALTAELTARGYDVAAAAR